MEGDWERERGKNYLVCIFCHVAHRAKQLSKGHKLSNASVYRCKQRLRRVCDATDDEGEVDESFVGAAKSHSFFPESRSTSGDERSLSSEGNQNFRK